MVQHFLALSFSTAENGSFFSSPTHVPNPISAASVLSLAFLGGLWAPSVRRSASHSSPSGPPSHQRRRWPSAIYLSFSLDLSFFIKSVLFTASNHDIIRPHVVQHRMMFRICSLNYKHGKSCQECVCAHRLKLLTKWRLCCELLLRAYRAAFYWCLAWASHIWSVEHHKCLFFSIVGSIPGLHYDQRWSDSSLLHITLLAYLCHCRHPHTFFWKTSPVFHNSPPQPPELFFFLFFLMGAFSAPHLFSFCSIFSHVHSLLSSPRRAVFWRGRGAALTQTLPPSIVNGNGQQLTFDTGSAHWRSVRLDALSLTDL